MVDSVARLAHASRLLPDVRGKANVGWLIQRRLRRPRSEPWRLRLADGTVYALPGASQMSWTVAFRGSYDAHLQRALAPHIRRDSLVLDVGASIGLWTIPLARAARRVTARVWAFEPLPSNVSWLRQNIELNGLDDTVTVHDFALGDAASAVRMFSEEGGGNAAIAVAQDEAKGSVVPVKRLDDVPRDRRVSLIKMDVEGYEPRVLRGAERLLQEDRPVILAEFGREWLENRGEDFGMLSRWLGEMGYEILEAATCRSARWRAPDGVQLRPVDTRDGERLDGFLLRPSVERPPAHPH